MDPISLLNSNWQFVASAPLAALGCAALGYGVAFWYLTGRIEEYKLQVSRLERTISDYKERLGFLPPDRSAYSKMTNKELQTEVSRLAEKMEEFQQSLDSERAESLGMTWARPGDSVEEQRDHWRMATYTLMKRSDENTRKFGTELRPLAITLREEILKRIPKEAQPTIVALDHGMLAGVKPVLEAATYLRQIALKLPGR